MAESIQNGPGFFGFSIQDCGCVSVERVYHGISRSRTHIDLKNISFWSNCGFGRYNGITKREKLCHQHLRAEEFKVGLSSAPNHRSISVNRPSPEIPIHLNITDASCERLARCHAKIDEVIDHLCRCYVDKCASVVPYCSTFDQSLCRSGWGNSDRRRVCTSKGAEFFKMFFVFDRKTDVDSVLAVILDASICHQEPSPICTVWCDGGESLVVDCILSVSDPLLAGKDQLLSVNLIAGEPCSTHDDRNVPVVEAQSNGDVLWSVSRQIETDDLGPFFGGYDISHTGYFTPVEIDSLPP